MVGPQKYLVGGARGRSVRRVVTLGTPHRGTPAALLGALVLGLFSRAIWQMIPGSPLLRELARLPVPAGSEIVAVASDADNLVPGPFARPRRMPRLRCAGVSGLGEFAEHIKSGKMRALAVSAPSKTDGIPALKEQGIDVELGNWRGVFGAPGLSAQQREALVKLVKGATETPAWKASQVSWIEESACSGDAWYTRSQGRTPKVRCATRARWHALLCSIITPFGRPSRPKS